MAITVEELQVLITAKTSGLRKTLESVTSQFKNTDKAAKEATAAVDAHSHHAQSVGKNLSSLTAALENTNKRIDLQKQKITELKESQNGLTTVAQQQMKALETESFGLEEQIRGTTAQLKQMKAAQANAISPFHADLMSDDIVATEQALSGLIAKADEVGKKMADLDDAGDSTKLKQQIASAEGSLLSLQQRAEKTQAAITKALNPPSSGIDNAAKSVKTLSNHMHGVSKSADQAGKSFDHARHGVNSLSNDIKMGIRWTLLQIFIFSLLSTAIKSFAGYLSSNLKTNAQYVASLNAIKTNLAVAFQPIYSAILPAINALMAWLAKATAYIAAFISALFGSTYKQSYNAAKGIETAKKAMEGYGKSAKKSGKDSKLAMAAFDQLNTLSFAKDADADSGAGKDDGFTMQMPDMDINGIQSKMDKLAAGVKSTFQAAWDDIKKGWDWTTTTFGPSFKKAWGEISPVLDQWKEQFKKMFGDILTLGEPLENWFLTGVVPFWQRGIELAGHVLSGLGDSAQKVVATLWDAAFPIIDKFVTDGLPRLTDFLMGAQEIFGKLFDLVKQIFDDIWSGAVDPAMKLVSHIIQDTLDIIFDWWDKWGKKILDGLNDTLDGIKKLWDSLWNGFLKPFIDNMLSMLTQLWDKHLKGLVAQVADFVGRLINDAQDILNKFILPIVTWLVEKLGPTFANIFSYIGDVIGTLLGVVADVTKGLIKMLGGIIDFLTGVFTGNWEKAWGGIRDIIVGVTDAMVGIFKGAINLIIDAINFMIRQLNQIKINVPDWVGKIPGVPDNIGSIGFNIPTIPKLAVGTNYVAGDGLAYLHQGEAVVPKKYNPAAGGSSSDNGNKEMIDLMRQLIQAVKDGGTVVIGRDEVGKAAVGYMEDYRRQTGQPAITV